MSTHRIHVFVSHSWAYSNHYETLYGWIFGNGWRYGQASPVFRDYSVPKDDPIHGASSDWVLREAINSKIARSHVVVIPTGMYVNYSNWIQKEIDGAIEKSKPILGVNPWGQLRTSSVVGQAADKTVGWNKESVVKAIWELYRQS